MEWLEGTSVRRVDRLDDLGFDRSALADVLLRASLQQMLVDGRFHADPHPGNIMVLSDGRIGLIDFGAASRLDPLQQASVRQMLVAIAEQSPTLLRQALLEVAEVPEGFDDLRFERALARFMARRLGPGAMPDAAMINELFQLLFGFRITVPSEFSTFFRALVTLEGTVTTLSPGYPVIEEAEKLASEWAVSQLEPAALADTARKEALTLLPILRRMPYHLDRISTLVERGDFTARVSLLSNRSDLQALSRLVNRVVLALLGGVVGILSVMLLGIEGGPTFTGDTSLFQFFGYFGLFCATVLILRVLLAVMREGPD
jgi:ubiquinone biosynthesis protein